MSGFNTLKFKKHIEQLFDSQYPLQIVQMYRLQIALNAIFDLDPKAEVRIRINNNIYFIQITDMEEIGK